MRSSEIVERLQAELPKRTALFSNSVSITSLTRSGSAVTAVCAAAHNLSTGDDALIRGALELNPITSLTFADGIASAVTQNNHDLTLPTADMIRFGNTQSFNFAPVSGADQAEYNIAALVSSVPNRKNFSYPVTGSPASPATGSPALEQEGGYNGLFSVTVIDPTTFTYQITTTPASPASGTIVAETGSRISSAVSAERALRSYTEQSTDDYWLFVVLGDVNISKDRSVLTDAASENSVQNEYRDRLIEPFRVFVMVPGVTAYSGREFQDAMEDVRGYIYNSLAGFIFGSALFESPWCKTSPLGDRFAEEMATNAVYVHEFSFQRVVDVTYPDTIGPPESRAFRDVSVSSRYQFGTEELESTIDLDEDPLP